MTSHSMQPFRELNHPTSQISTHTFDAETGVTKKVPPRVKEGLSVNIQLHRLPVQSQDVWVWHISDGEAIRELSNNDVTLLEEEGWQLLDPTDSSFPFLALISQLADTLPVLLTDSSKIRTLAKNEAISFAEDHPVILAFAYQDAEHPPLLPGPPAQLGELGLILQGNQVQPYKIAQLEEEGLQLCQSLRTSLGMFLSTSLTVAERESAWQDAQNSARMLAKRYWDVHQQMLLAEPAEMHPAVQSIDLGSPSVSTRRLRSKQLPALPITRPEMPEVAIPVDPITQELMRSLLDGRSYALFPEERIAEHVHRLPIGQGAMRITIQPGSGEEWESVLKSLKMLGDEVVDTFCAMLAIAIETNGPANMTDAFFLDVDDILKVCQRQQSHRAYTPLQRAHIVEHLRTLSRVHIMASAPGKGAIPRKSVGKPRRKHYGDEEETFKAINSTVLDLLGTTIGEYFTLTGETLWERREVKIGRWAQFAPSLSPQTAILLRKVLQYHAQRQRHEKRIGRWLTLQFQVQSGRNAGAVVCNTHTLLEQSGIKPDLNKPGEVRLNIEDAVAQLAQDNVIGAYRKAVVLDQQTLKMEKQAGTYQNSGTEFEEAEKQDKYEILARTPEEYEILRQIKERARGWWILYENHVWWVFAPPLPANQKAPLALLSPNDNQ